MMILRNESTKDTYKWRWSVSLHSVPPQLAFIKNWFCGIAMWLWWYSCVLYFVSANHLHHCYFVEWLILDITSLWIGYTFIFGIDVLRWKSCLIQIVCIGCASGHLFDVRCNGVLSFFVSRSLTFCVDCNLQIGPLYIYSTNGKWYNSGIMERKWFVTDYWWLICIDSSKWVCIW